MESTILFLDDERHRFDDFVQRHPEATWVSTAAEAIQLLPERPWAEVWLDHDLDGSRGQGQDPMSEESGSEVVRFICTEYPLSFDAKIVVHSQNAMRALPMVARLYQAGYTATYRPWGWPADPDRDHLVRQYCAGLIELNAVLAIMFPITKHAYDELQARAKS